MAVSDRVNSVHQHPSSFAPQPNVSPQEAQTESLLALVASDIKLKLLNQRIVFFVRTDPKPDHLVAASRADRPPSDPDPRRENGFIWMNLFELKAWMIWILLPEPV